MAAQRSLAPLDMLEQTLNEVLIHTGKALRAQAKNGRKTVALSSTKIFEANNTFNTILDNLEGDIVRAKATLLRDLEQIRAQKSAAAAAAAAAVASSSLEQSTAAVHQAPPAPMDIDTEEMPGPSVPIKSQSETPANNTPSVMAPFPNMDVDSPTMTATAPPTATMTAAAVNVSSQSPQITAPAPAKPSPVIKKEPMRSPQRMAKPMPTPGGAKPGATGAVGSVRSPAMKIKSPVVVKAAPSPANSRATEHPVAAKIPSPALVKSATASPVVIKASTSQPPTPNVLPTTAPKAISLSSSSSSPIMVTSPVMMKQTASASSAIKNISAAKATPPKVAAQLPISTQVMASAPAPAPAAVPGPMSMPISTPAVTAAATAAHVPSTANGADISMDDFFDLTGPSDSAERDNSNLGYTNKQFSLVPAGNEAQHAPQQVTPAPAPAQAHPHPHPHPQPQPQPHQQPPPPVQVPPSQSQPLHQMSAPTAVPVPVPVTAPAQQIDDSDFDVEKFAADAAQNLMDTTFASGQANAGGAQRQQNPAPHPPTTQPPADDIMALFGGDSAADSTTGIDNGDDLFKFIDDPGDGLGEDPTTSFDELYMGGTDSIDIDNYFDMP